MTDTTTSHLPPLPSPGEPPGVRADDSLPPTASPSSIPLWPAWHSDVTGVEPPVVSGRAALGGPIDDERLGTVAAAFGYRLLDELGRGAFARVFLAEQARLAGRPVVLKLSAAAGREPQTLAQMQHTHIVPIYSLHEDLVLGVRAVCMPYLGGASLAVVLRALREATPRPAHGRELVAAHEAVGSGPPGVGPQPGPCGPTPLDLFRGWSYLRCAAWVVARLAEGVQHAHDRGVLHRDIKPSNVLIAGDGQPLLLDFNVAHWDDPAAGVMVLGGTAAYAAPEHLEAMLDPTPANIARVDHRADLYSLGLVLYEMATGESAFRHGTAYSEHTTLLADMLRDRGRFAPSVRGTRPDAAWGLESIVRKCLAPDPADRYQQAAHLADDLRRLLDDRPLRHAPEPSRVEAARKWARRHPRLTSAGSVAAVAAVLLAGAVGAAVGVRQHLTAAQAQLQATEDRDRQQAYEAGALRALCLVNMVSDLDDHAAAGARVCEETLSRYGVLDDAGWQDRPAWRRLAPDDRRRLAETTRDLLQLLAWARTRTGPRDEPTLRGALALLDRAEAVDGLPPSRSLRTDRVRYLDALGQADAARRTREEAEALPPAGANDHYRLAAAYARGGTRADHLRAVSELDHSLRLNPQHYWARMQRGICHQELGEFTLAAADFGTCVGLRPELPWAYFNRGYALARAGKRPQAVEDFTAALGQDAGFVLAYVNRGVLRLELAQDAAAIADFDEAARRGRDDAFLHAGRGVALERLGRPAEADAAFDAAFARVGGLPPAAQARVRWSYGFAVARRRPDRASEAFDAVLRDDPTQPQALYGRAMLAVERGDLPAARGFADRAVAADPASVPARRCRAIIRARLGAFDGAEQDVNWCLDRDPRCGETLYAAACVAARAAARFPQSTAAAQAVHLLQQAMAEGYGRDRAEADPDLSAVRDSPDFARLFGRTPAPSPTDRR